MEPSAMAEVEETRQRILAAFEHQVTSSEHKKGEMPLRLANLLLLLPPLMAIGRDLVEEAQLAKLFGKNCTKHLKMNVSTFSRPCECR
jgi:hypothetical protein